MTQEEKDLLFKDLSARLLYGVMVNVQGGEFDSYKYPYLLTAVSKFGFDCLCKVYHPIYTPFGTPKIEEVKPYLRPMSSMTELEDKDFALLQVDFYTDGWLYPIPASNLINWLNKHHFDYQGLIERGLAVEAPEGMYKI